MDIEVSRSRDFFEHHSVDFKECDHPECQKADSPFSFMEPEDEQLESSSNHYCHSYKDACIPVIFYRRYNFADRELCSRHFSIRLGGLRNKMAAVLRKYIGCPVIIGTECDKSFKKIHGKVSYVGTDFVEIAIHKRGEKFTKKKYRMIPFDSINWFETDQSENA